MKAFAAASRSAAWALLLGGCNLSLQPRKPPPADARPTERLSDAEPHAPTATPAIIEDAQSGKLDLCESADGNDVRPCRAGGRGTSNAGAPFPSNPSAPK